MSVRHFGEDYPRPFQVGFGLLHRGAPLPADVAGNASSMSDSAREMVDASRGGGVEPAKLGDDRRVMRWPHS